MIPDSFTPTRLKALRLIAKTSGRDKAMCGRPAKVSKSSWGYLRNNGLISDEGEEFWHARITDAGLALVERMRGIR